MTILRLLHLFHKFAMTVYLYGIIKNYDKSITEALKKKIWGRGVINILAGGIDLITQNFLSALNFGSFFQEKEQKI